jgi:hypothetical protein
MPKKAVEVSETGAQVEILLPLARRGRANGDGGRGRAKSPAAPTIPRIARLMALAVKFQDMVDQGEVPDYAAIARLGYVTRARLTQIMNLTLLAPDVQEALLLEEAVGDTFPNERGIRAVVGVVGWEEQRRLFREMTAYNSASR